VALTSGDCGMGKETRGRWSGKGSVSGGRMGI